MTYVTDPIGDLLTRMRNAQKAGRASCTVPMSRLRMELLNVFKREGWIAAVETTGEAPKLKIEVTFVPEKTLTLKRVSKPGRRTYVSVGELKNPVLHGFGMAVLTTSKGILTDAQARKENVGGELLCTIS
ncbi:30S ribosomal protein S8 [Candidatus Peregrinibacteria bacterium]|nr:30S ribosomal protein S8 [Candidatus Peregrinibacteria bacterium]